MYEDPSTFMDLRFHVQTFGCQMNKHDSERIAGMLESLGALAVSSIEEADVVVFMTCCVREAADIRLIGQVNTMKNLPVRPGSTIGRRIVAIGGCIGQRDGAKLFDEAGHVDIVFGTSNLGSLPGLLADVLERDVKLCDTHEAEGFSSELPTSREHSWAAWLPITVGCNNYCTYCIVPYVRGRERSRELGDIAAEARRYVSAGVKEITLLGQNVNSYGRDLYGKPRFADVLEAVAQTGVERLRFATSHPKDLTDEVIGKFSSIEALMPALHLPVQSGSDKILEAMNRRYTVEHYLELVAKVRDARPGIALSTDVIVGFPGETERDFSETSKLIEEVGYSQVFTFIYSRREGTPAASLVDDTPREIVQERFDRLVDIVQRSAYECNQLELGSTVEVLVEGRSKRDANLLSGKSPKNQTVHAPIPAGTSIEALAGTIVPVEIEEARTWYLRGHIAQQPSSMRID